MKLRIHYFITLIIYESFTSWSETLFEINHFPKTKMWENIQGLEGWLVGLLHRSPPWRRHVNPTGTGNTASIRCGAMLSGIKYSPTTVGCFGN